jgi:hypothetical protein
MVPARLTGALVALAALGAPGAAAAATLDPLKPCYVSVDPETRENVEIRAAGFSPFSYVDVAIDGVTVQTAQADVDGALPSASVAAPYQEHGERPFTLTVTEQGEPANAAGASALVTALRLRVRPAQAKPSRRVRFRGRGFTGEGRLYAHYLYEGELRRTVGFGRPEGPCGTFRVRRRQIPVHHPRTGHWTLQVDQQRDYSVEPATVFVRLSIIVERVLRSAVGSAM